MVSLLAYMPVFNNQHLQWLKRHRGADLFLIRQHMAEEFLPRLARNMGVLPPEVTANIVRTRSLMRIVEYFSPEEEDPDLGSPSGNWKQWILPDEDISHLVAEKYLLPAGCKVSYEQIWARWDMSAVKAAQPVIPDCEVSQKEIDIFRMVHTEQLSQRSPDLWRQIGVMAFRGDELIAVGVNSHYPTEYETSIFGDPRINFDAGDPDGMDAYVSLHAEEYLVAFCAANGISLRDASVLINTFPCGRCARVLSEAGIKELFFREGSAFLKGFEILKNRKIRIVQVRTDPGSA